MIASELDTETLLAQAAALVDGERDWVANAANISALIGTQIPGLNWSGVYVLQGDGLVLGPFYGKPACVRIALGSGVCGTAAQQRATIVVPDVHAFPGHIACDPASQSEIVVPLLAADSANRTDSAHRTDSPNPRTRLIGVLDIDSPYPARFGAVERAFFESVADLLVRSSDWPDRTQG
jgi:GAF domain-containing protein